MLGDQPIRSGTVRRDRGRIGVVGRRELVASILQHEVDDRAIDPLEPELVL